MKAKNTVRLFLFPAVLCSLLLLQGCPQMDPDDPNDPDAAAKRYLRTQCMDVFYYWRSDVIDRNAGIDPSSLGIYDYFDAMLYEEDRWSWMCDKESYVAGETGVYSGTWGVSMGQAWEYYGDYSLRVRYVYPGSPLERYGVTRGAELRRIGGHDVVFDEGGFTAEKAGYYQEGIVQPVQTFTFRLTDGRDTTFTASMASQLATRPSLVVRVFRPGDFPGLTEPVGYFHYLSFKAGFLDDIEEAMDTFRDAGVRKLIVDLRYNGGGDSRASQLLVDCLAPSSAVGKPYVIRRHNDYLSAVDKAYSDAENTYTIAANGHSLDPEAVYFITGDGSASASEMIMNGLKPYFGDRMQMVGDTTYGKPNGMYVLMYPGKNSDYKDYNNGDFRNLRWVFLPISFFNMNSQEQLIPTSGFVPDSYCPDDLFHDFGVEEAAVRACLHRIVQGRYPGLPDAPVSVGTKTIFKSDYRIDTEEDNPHYGLYTVQKAVF